MNTEELANIQSRLARYRDAPEQKLIEQLATLNIEHARNELEHQRDPVRAAEARGKIFALRELLQQIGR